MTWTMPLTDRRGPARRRLVVFPHAGAGPSSYWPLVSRDLPADTEILGVVLPGREHRMNEPFATDLQQVVRSIVAELRSTVAMPTVFFGHSFGALLAAAVTVSCPGVCHAAVLSSQLPPPQFRFPRPGALIDAPMLLATGEAPAEIRDNPALRGWLLDLLGADLDLCRQAAHFIQDAKLDVPVGVLGGTTDEVVAADLLPGWQPYASTPLRLRLLPGGHFYLRQEDAAAQVRAELRALLDQAQTHSTKP